MKNNVTCGNCNHENPFYRHTCLNCRAFLRTKIPNVEFSNILGNLLDSPKKAFTELIYAEQKNFIVGIMFFFSLKFFVNALLIGSYFGKTGTISDSFFVKLGAAVIAAIVILFLFAGVITIVNSIFGLANRFKDNLAIYTYSLLPQVAALAILLPVEYALFGGYLFSNNPTPFVIKPMAAYVLSGIEGLMILVSLFYAIAATRTQTNSLIYSIIIGVLFIAVLFAGMFYLPVTA